MQPHRTAAIYCRVSTMRQDTDGTSLETQEAACRQLAAERGYTVSEPHVYREIHTGADLHRRPRMSALRAAVRNHEIDAVIFHAVDRLSRNQAHVYIVTDEIERNGLAIFWVTEDFEDSAVGRFIRSAKAFAAEVEREKIIERTQRGVQARVDKGKPLPGYKPPYGYVWADDETKERLTVDPLMVPIVQRIFGEASRGYSLRRIAEGLTRDGIPRPGGQSAKVHAPTAWNYLTVRYILSQPIYIGRATAKKWVTSKLPDGKRQVTRRPDAEQILLPDGVAPALVSVAAFEAARQRIEANRNGRVTRRSAGLEAALLRGGHVRCGYCERPMVVHDPGNNRRLVYRCNTRDRFGIGAGNCTSHGITVAVLDEEVWDGPSQRLKTPEIIIGEWERMRSEDGSAEDMASVDRVLAENGRQRANLTRRMALLDDDDAAALVATRLSELSALARKLEAERAAVLARRAEHEASRRRMEDVARWCTVIAAEIDTLDWEGKRDALLGLGVEVRVWRKDHEPRADVRASLPSKAQVLAFSIASDRGATRRRRRDRLDGCCRRPVARP